MTRSKNSDIIIQVENKQSYPLSPYGEGFTVNMTEKNFKPVEINIVHDSASNKSLKTLYEHLTATEFCNFLKDNEIPYTKF